MKLAFVNQSQIPMPKKFLTHWSKIVLRLLQTHKAKNLSILKHELTIVFLDTGPAKALNLQFRGKDYATDILSFAGQQDGAELVLCPQVVRRQAKEHGLSFRAELGYMILHGYLHLLGYDHEKSEKQAKVMFNLQDKVFALAAKRAGLDWLE
jgi:probable rRNA maturation factor